MVFIVVPAVAFLAFFLCFFIFLSSLATVTAFLPFFTKGKASMMPPPLPLLAPRDGLGGIERGMERNGEEDGEEDGRACGSGVLGEDVEEDGRGEEDGPDFVVVFIFTPTRFPRDVEISESISQVFSLTHFKKSKLWA